MRDEVFSDNVAGKKGEKMNTYVPFLTRRFYLALQFAGELHYREPRKGTPIPYIAHLMSVCALVLEAGGDEDQAIAALLHSAIEKHGGSSTLSTIRELFGTRVADALEFRSGGSASDLAKKANWRREGEVSRAFAKCEPRCAIRCRRRQASRRSCHAFRCSGNGREIMVKIQRVEKRPTLALQRGYRDSAAPEGSENAGQ